MHDGKTFYAGKRIQTSHYYFEALLRRSLAKAGGEVPLVVNHEIANYINNPGEKKLNLKPEQEFKDPTGIQDMLLPEKMKGF
ncbi:MAG: hypothetical protein WA705_17050 [Candidatus Ozemobacteraceae bacterium]